MMATGGCLLVILTLIALWTALLLYSGLATSLAWGERDEENPIIWIRQDVPVLLRIALAAAVAAAILLTVAVRRTRRTRAAAGDRAAAARPPNL
jgi:uncharacterized BrkB/YihY/UPF0761 family membrane protein